MDKNLTTSDLHRRNILNNRYALLEIEKEVAFPGIPFEATIKYTKKQIADFYDIDVRTIERYIDQHEEELLANGYEVLKGKRLKVFNKVYSEIVTNRDDSNPINGDVTDIDVGDISRAPKLGVFDFRTFLNIGMLLTESNRAKQLRSLILDMVIDTINAKIGGVTKYINQREEEFLPSAIREFNYRENFPSWRGRLAREHYNWYIHKVYIAKLAVRDTVIVRQGYTNPTGALFKSVSLYPWI